jgi:hypothetical protein
MTPNPFWNLNVDGSTYFIPGSITPVRHMQAYRPPHCVYGGFVFWSDQPIGVEMATSTPTRFSLTIQPMPNTWGFLSAQASIQIPPDTQLNASCLKATSVIMPARSNRSSRHAFSTMYPGVMSVVWRSDAIPHVGLGPVVQNKCCHYLGVKSFS